MGINRITSGFLTSQAGMYLSRNLDQLSNMQEKLSSGQNIRTLSDDPIGLTRILDLSNTIRTDARYSRNIQDAIAETNTADTVLSNMTDLIQRAQELTTQAANFSNNQDGRNAIALEIDQIINQMVQLGNTDISGKYLFAGFKTDTPPFSRSGDDITYSGTQPTEAWQRDVEISRGVALITNVIGDELLGQVSVNTAAPPLPPVFNAGSHGLFKTLVELKQDLEATGDPNQLVEIRSRLDELSTDLNTVLSKQAIIGSVANRLELTRNRIDDRKSVLTNQFAAIQDINVAETVANLNQQQNVFQASLNVTGRILQANLIDFLR